ncbi:hypothetical protein AM571_CH01121 [Rhizobium etli 8C-3]|uniref:DUF1772 domain-containing protein n=1 Tax=Rhizobium etli 8C-3 TaxID=538025 RepID=A0A1L5P1F5_RHIET|nr:DUF1772 domain-containing protein [Rhizobium etli]APO73958.1 hypothetical protein AM571_CH01121 [Rhizobium etli 8C-3]
MFQALEILTVLVVAVAMALALAHALELPGKMRLSKEQYLAVQPIYYPGFTFGGIAEPLGLIMTLALIVLTPPFSGTYWLTAGAFVSLLAMHAIYWMVTHPVNNYWLKEQQPEGAGKRFFSFRSHRDANEPDWTVLRDRWERSHLLRAIFGLVSLILLVAAVAA